MVFGCSKEPSQRDGSFEYPKHIFGCETRKLIFDYTLLSEGLFKYLKNIKVIVRVHMLSSIRWTVGRMDARLIAISPNLVDQGIKSKGQFITIL